MYIHVGSAFVWFRIVLILPTPLTLSPESNDPPNGACYRLENLQPSSGVTLIHIPPF
jgi:hypothetical protein